MKWLTSLFLAVLFVLGGIYCSIYEGLYLLYYEETKANSYAMILLFPLLIWFVIATFRERFKYSLKESPILDATWESIKMFFSGLIGLFVLRTIVSGFIVLTNTVIPFEQENVVLEGKVVAIFRTATSRLDDFEIHVDRNGELFELDTNRPETEKYVDGIDFRLELKKGFWGLLYKAK